MGFKEATTRAIRACITLADVAETTGVSHQRIRTGRLEQGTAAYRPPPQGWEPKLAKLARSRAAELLNLAEELEG